MAKLTLNIIADIKDVNEKITSIKTKLSEIGSKPIKIIVDASGLDAISQKIKIVTDAEIRAAEAAAKLANAEARKINAQTRAAESAAKLAREQGKAAKAANAAAQAQNNVAASTALVIKNVGTLEAKITSLTRAYEQLAQAQKHLGSGNAATGYLGSGGGGGVSTGNERAALPSPGALVASGSRTIEWSRYGDFRDNVIDVDWKPVVDGANAAAGAVNNAASAAGKAQSSFNTMREGMSAAWGKMKEGTPIADALGDSIGNIIVKITTWQVVNGVVASIKRSFKEALDMLKAVDDELVTVRKVTGFDDNQIAKLKNQAFEVASAYGETADAYLESVAAFSRAGYKEQSAELAELSTKTQIVGDTTAEVANQFLLSVDAAYKYGGSIKELSAVLDGANELDNKYATSIEKIAEGMGIVAPVASQMHVTIDELAAAIGTITAVTQRSGSEAARALRALFLNIAGDTKTEIDEGVTWTTGEIAGLRDVIKLYAKDAYDAAQASKGIIDPMRAMEGLAKSMQDGVLTEQKLIEMVSDIGGKLRTSQLLAIIQNWDMYQSMLQDYAGAIGSADKEVENALDSWTRKTNILKNTWAEFISHLIDTNGIKGGIDLLTGFVRVLDSGVGKVAALAAAFLGIGKIIAQIGKTNVFNFLLNEIVGLATGTVTAGVALADLWALLSTNPVFWAAAAAAALYGIYQLVDKLNVTYDEQKEKLEELEKEYDSMYGESGELARLKENVGKLTDAERERLGVLESQRHELEEQIKLQKEATFDAWRKEQTRLDYEDTGSGNQFNFGTSIRDLTSEEVENAKNALYALHAEMDNGQHTQEGYINGLKGIISSLSKSAEAIRGGRDAGKELSDSEKALLALYEELSLIVGSYTEDTEKNTAAKSDNAAATEEVAEANTALQTALEEVGNKGNLTYGTLEQLDRLYPGLSSRILDANGNLTAEGQAALSTKAAFVDLIGQLIVFNNSSLDVSQKILALQELAQQAGVTGASLQFINGGEDVQRAVDNWRRLGLSQSEAESRVLSGYYGNWSSRVNKALTDQEYLKTPGGGGGGGGGSTTDAELDALKAIVDLRKQELSFLKESGASEADQLAKMREIQAALHDQADYLRATGGSQKDILALSTEWWNIENDILATQEKIAEQMREEQLAALKETVALRQSELDLMQAQGASYDAQIAKIREIQSAIDAQLAEMQRQGASQREINELLLQREKLESSILEIEKKQREEAIAVIEAQMKALDAEKDAKVKALREQIDALKEQHDQQQQINTLAEKELAVRKALEALENARRERNVRQYNSKTEQWEWVADPKAIADAEKAWEDAKKAVEDYESDLEYQEKIRELEAEIGEIEAEYQSLKDALQGMIDELNNATGSLKKINEDYLKIVGDLDELSNGDKSLKEKILKLISTIANQDGLAEDAKKKLLELLGVMFSDKNLSTESKNRIVDMLQTIFDNPKLTAEAKAKIVEGIDAMVGQGKDVLSATELFTQFVETAIENADDPEAAINDLVKKLKDGTLNLKNGIDGIIKKFNETGDETARMLLIAQMRENSLEWHTAGSERQAELHAENVKIGKALGWTYDPSTGYWYDRQGRIAYQLGVTGGSTGGGGGTGGGTEDTGDDDDDGGDEPGSDPSDETDNSDYLNTPNDTTVKQSNGQYAARSNRGNMISAGVDGTWFIDNEEEGVTTTINGVSWTKGAGKTAIATWPDGETVRFFDRGGILRGKGGIKATDEDEMVLPPSMTRGLLNAEATGAFDALLRHLGIVTAAANGVAGFGGAITGNSIGEQHNGDVFYIDGVKIPNVTTGTTLGELARYAKNLSLYKGS